jgi:hypothetical protein
VPLVATRSNAGAFGLGWSAAGAGEELGGMVLLTPTSVETIGTGSSATIGVNGQVTFSACVEVSLNGVFSADYDNYQVVCRDNGTFYAWHMRLRAAGSDDQTANSYTRQQIVADDATISAARASYDFWQAPLVGFSPPDQNGLVMHFYGPFLSQPTAARTVAAMSANGAYLLDRAYTHYQSTSYDGLTITTLGSGSANFGGTVSVYGLVGA